MRGVMTSVKRVAGTALSVIVVLLDHHKSLRDHRDTRTLEHSTLFYHNAPSPHSTCFTPIKDSESGLRNRCSLSYISRYLRFQCFS